MNELRAPRRHRKLSHESDALPWVFALVALIVLGGFAWAKYQQHSEQKLALAHLEAQQAAERAEYDRQAAEITAAAERRRKNWERSQASQSDQRSFTDVDVPPQRYQQAPQKSVAQRQAEALAIMQESRSIQRQADRQEYSRDGNAQVIAGNPNKRAICEQIEAERDSIHTRMRQLYTVREGEYFRSRLRDNHDRRIRFGC